MSAPVPQVGTQAVAGFVHDGEVVCGQCYTRFVKTQEVVGEANVMVLRFVCWRGHKFALAVQARLEAERVRMEWVLL